MLELANSDATCGPDAALNYKPVDKKGARVTGTITGFNDGRPLANVKLAMSASNENGRTLLRSVTDKQGGFVLAGIKPGYYDFVLTRSGYLRETIKHVLVPRENVVVIDSTMLDRPVVCQ